jgi:hypothetical protein
VLSALGGGQTGVAWLADGVTVGEAGDGKAVGVEAGDEGADPLHPASIATATTIAPSWRTGPMIRMPDHLRDRPAAAPEGMREQDDSDAQPRTVPFGANR